MFSNDGKCHCCRRVRCCCGAEDLETKLGRMGIEKVPVKAYGEFAPYSVTINCLGQDVVHWHLELYGRVIDVGHASSIEFANQMVHERIERHKCDEILAETVRQSATWPKHEVPKPEPETPSETKVAMEDFWYRVTPFNWNHSTIGRSGISYSIEMVKTLATSKSEEHAKHIVSRLNLNKKLSKENERLRSERDAFKAQAHMDRNLASERVSKQVVDHALEACGKEIDRRGWVNLHIYIARVKRAIGID